MRAIIFMKKHGLGRVHNFPYPFFAATHDSAAKDAPTDKLSSEDEITIRTRNMNSSRGH